ncbi:hypothetical protein NDU88_004510 [Pleurodeles waltl]|uniref:Uncharacterized protein n=1 Tax=Pleurodeles waltl TaxID=8319 RepID=A0AAV7MVC5_PLEWA|nr:hypothetical protein NDU88_004510 [Pleurodeles waltl]
MTWENRFMQEWTSEASKTHRKETRHRARCPAGGGKASVATRPRVVVGADGGARKEPRRGALTSHIQEARSLCARKRAVPTGFRRARR